MVGNIAVADAGASGHFGWEDGAARWTMSAETGQELETDGGIITCNEVAASGGLNGTSPSTVLTTEGLAFSHNGSPNCITSIEGFEPSMESNGCEFIFHAGETVDGNQGEVEIFIDLVCPPNQEYVANGGFLCTIKVPSQAGLTSSLARTVTSTPEKVTIEFDVGNIKYTMSGICAGFQTVTRTNGRYKGKAIMTAESDATQAKSITVT